MPKNKKLNAFYFFLVDFKEQEEKKGRKFPNGLRDVQSDIKCNEIWKNLSETEKNVYKVKAKKSQIETKVSKKTSTGESYDLIIKEQQEQEKFLNKMQENILLTLQQAKQNNCITNLNFFVIHVNIFYQRTTDIQTEYCPAEIAIAEFSISKGITRIYNEIINSEIQIGYNAVATEYSRNTHQIPKNPSNGEKDYSVIYRKICEFLQTGKKNGNLPPLYTRYNLDLKNQVQYVLDKLADYSNSFTNFVVYSLEELYVNLRNINIDINSDEGKFDNVIASLKLQEDPYDHYKTLQCDFHQTIAAGSFCSKSVVQRWIYSIFPYTCRLNGVNFTKGIHEPLNNQSFEKKINLDFEETEFTKVSSRKVRTSHAKSKTPILNDISNPSERTYRDEERRKAKSREKPLEIIYHNSNDSSNQQCNSTWNFEQFKQINLDDDNFPSIEKGSENKRKTFDNKNSCTDYASRLK